MGNREQNLREAVSLCEERVGRLLHTSSVYSTAAWGVTDQPDFFNQVLVFSTNLSAREVLEKVLKIEADMGRVRLQKWGQRLIDIDLLYFDDMIINEPDLKIPHPFIQARKFVLIPLSEIAPDFVHPVLFLSNLQLLKQTDDQSSVIRLID